MILLLKCQLAYRDALLAYSVLSVSMVGNVPSVVFLMENTLFTTQICFCLGNTDFGDSGFKGCWGFLFACFLVSFKLRAESLHLSSVWETPVILTLPCLMVLQQENIML